MKINRHNYEEFFLLYLDNELTSAQRTEVEAFLKNNADLEEEMTMLKQVVLTDEKEVEFDAKNTLYKTEHGVCLANYEEYFLLYVDEELSQKEKEDVEKFVLTHPPLQEAFTQLRATKLQPEVVEFRNKESLYRTEKERRVVPFGWMRMAAAAAVIGLITMLWVSTRDADKTDAGTGIVAKQDNQLPTKTIAPNNTVKADEGVVASSDVQPSAVEETTQQGIASTQKTSVVRNAVTLPVNVTPNTKIVQPPVEERSLAVVDVRPAENRKSNTITEPNVEKTSVLSQPTLVANTSENKSMVEQAVYREADDEEEDDRTLYIGGAEINKNKLRGLFKKATSIFDKKGKKADKENTVQIASFEIKTK